MSDLFAGLSVNPSASPGKTAKENGDATPTTSATASTTTTTTTTASTTTAAAATSPPAQRLTSAPATDKLLGLLGTPPSSPAASRPAPSTPTSSNTTSKNPSNGTKIAMPVLQTPPTTAKKSVSTAPSPATTAAANNALATAEVLTAFSMESHQGKDTGGTTDDAPMSPSKATAAANDTDAATPLKSKPKASLRGVGTVTSTISNPEVVLRLFRKFAEKTQPNVPSSHGGTLKPTILRYLFGSTTVYDRKFDAYKSLMECVTSGFVFDTDDDDNDNGEETKARPASEVAPEAIARFCHLLNVWGHASAHMAEVESKSSAYPTFCDILAKGFDTATTLVTHGCLDGVLVETPTEGTAPPLVKGAVDILAESVFSCDLSQERVELAAMKFLLSTGCRNSSHDGQAMLHGTHLLQTIRVLYHVYLTTLSSSNKTTARASLQQLVTSVFIRMIATSGPAAQYTTRKDDNEDHDNEDNEDHDEEDGDHEVEFPTQNHRDAFLVLRSLCKLSMRTPPSNMHSHIGLQAGNSNTTWDAHNGGGAPKSPIKKVNASTHGSSEKSKSELPSLVYTQAIHPALESKILALELLLYVLQNTNMKGDFLRHSGTQFHYAIRHYLCVSLLKNCTSDDTLVVNLSLRVFVPIIHNFRSLLKNEIEAFVTNVFFVILDSKNSPIDHKSLVVTLFQEICSDSQTLAEIFLNYDCDLSAVDLFHRIVNTLAKVARSMELEDRDSTTSALSSLDISGAGAARMERLRSQHRELRLEAMRALRQVLASLHGSIVKPMPSLESSQQATPQPEATPAAPPSSQENGDEGVLSPKSTEKQSLVEIYGSKKKRREEEAGIILRFNRKPSAGIAYAAKCGHLDGSDPKDVARYLLAFKDKLDKTQIGEYLGREPDYQNGFAVNVLHGYVNMMDFAGLVFDDAIRYYLSGFRLPGEAQKIDRIMEKFAERFTAQNPDVFPTADVAFILAFSIIMLNTDLHNPAIKEERRMTKDGFIRNNRGICDGQDLPQEMLLGIFDRIKTNPISLKEDDEARERVGEGSASVALPSALSPAAFFTSSYEEADRTKETNFNKERDQIVRTTESLLRRRRQSAVDNGKGIRRHRSNSHSAKHQTIKYVRTEDSGLRDEYVSPMFEVAWGPALAAFSTAMESANGTVGALLAIATDEELEAAATNAAETIEVCLTGFRFAICTAGLCGNDVARDAFMLALARFSQLGTGILLEPRHVRCIQTILALARSDGELLGSSWEHVFRSLSEINRFHQLFQLLARNDRAIAVAAERRRALLEERERKLRERAERRAAKENSDTLDDASTTSIGGLSDTDLSYADSDLFSDSSDFDFHEDMDKKEIDEANARTVYEAVSEGLIEAIYERSSSMSTTAVKEFVLQLCRVSRMEISHYGGQVGSDANQVDLTQVQYRQHHSLLGDADGFHHHQPNIYNLQKLVEVTHYNMDSRPRLVFADIWTPVSAHLTSTALHSNPAVAMYAVDSFRQLCIQYLQREELGVFEFQRRFLKPLETVMSRSKVHTTKELLLKCVERLILMFGNENDGGDKRGMLKSGWRPILTVLGLAGREADEEIAKLGFRLLGAQLEPILAKNAKTASKKASPSALIAERFVDIVDALLVYVSGPHESMSLQCIEHLVKLSSFLADESFALPLIKKRAWAQSTSFDEGDVESKDGVGNEELELWWPILLGISRAIGDDRKKVRQKSLASLMQIITSHFFPADGVRESDEKAERRLQLQLIFRGILTPVLEFAEVDALDARQPKLPDDFDRFITGAKQPQQQQQGEAPKTQAYWLDNMFDQFMDGCVSICLKSVDALGEDMLVEEVFAMLNRCILSDSGGMAVRGLRRLEQFLTSDLRVNAISDDTWATVSHMLRRSLSLRGLPKDLNGTTSPAETSEQGDAGSDEVANVELERKEAIREFVMEDNMLANRRFVGGNAIQVIGSFLGGERFSTSLGLRWRIFLVTGVGKAVRDWELAAAILGQHGAKTKPRAVNPPNYLETAMYGRKYMNRFLLQMATIKEVVGPAADGSVQASAQTLLKEQTQALVQTFLEKDSAGTGGSPIDAKLLEKLTSLVKDMLAGYDKLPEDHISEMTWLNPVFGSCITTDNESIRIAIQKLVQRFHE